MLIEELFSTGIMKMGPSRVDPGGKSASSILITFQDCRRSNPQNGGVSLAGGRMEL